MRSRLLLSFLVVASLPVLALVGCGDDSGSTAAPDAEPDASATDGSIADSAPPQKDGGPDTLVDAGGLFVKTGGTFSAVSVDGILDGTAYFVDPKTPTDGVRSRLVVIFADRTALCSTGPLRASATEISIDLLSGDKPFTAGTFTQQMKNAPGQVDFGISKLGATCNGAGQDYGASVANVVLTQVAPTVAGTFDLTFPGDAGTLQGTFNVPICGSPFDTTCKP